jgi:hypothetical protein
MHIKFFFNNNLIFILVALKVIVAIATYQIFKIFLPADMLAASDISVYSNCSQEISNILYTKLLCSFGINDVEGIYSWYFISMAVIINTLLAVGYFITLEDCLSIIGKYLFLFLLVFHPYLAIYSVRFYSDIFGSIGIFITFYYLINIKSIDTFFTISSILLMHLRTQLIPVFIGLSFIVLISKRFLKKEKLMAIITLIAGTLAILYYSSFALFFFFSEENPNIGTPPDYPIWWNIISLFSFREGFAVSGPAEIFLNLNEFKLFQLLIMFILFLFHVVGMIGLYKFTLRKNYLIVTIVFLYVLPTLIGISHLRYLMPLIPIISFGFIYLFFKKPSIKL